MDPGEEPVELQENSEEWGGVIYTPKPRLQLLDKTGRQQRNMVNSHPDLTNYSKELNNILDFFTLYMTTKRKKKFVVIPTKKLLHISKSRIPKMQTIQEMISP